jgi:hypothetical protein
MLSQPPRTREPPPDQVDWGEQLLAVHIENSPWIGPQLSNRNGAVCGRVAATTAAPSKAGAEISEPGAGAQLSLVVAKAVTGLRICPCGIFPLGLSRKLILLASPAPQPRCIRLRLMPANANHWMRSGAIQSDAALRQSTEGRQMAAATLSVGVLLAILEAAPEIRVPFRGHHSSKLGGKSQGGRRDRNQPYRESPQRECITLDRTRCDPVVSKPGCTSGAREPSLASRGISHWEYIPTNVNPQRLSDFLTCPALRRGNFCAAVKLLSCPVILLPKHPSSYFPNS